MNLDFIEKCRQLIEIDSSPKQGCLEAINYVAELCLQQGMIVDIQKEKRGGLPQANLVAHFEKHKNCKEEVLLQAHLDTNDPGAFGLWSVTGHNPYNATIVDKKIYGLGAANVKLDFLCKLRAIEKFKDRDLQKRPVLAATFGAESGAAGAVRLIRKKKSVAKDVLVGAATGLKLWSAGKGSASVEIMIPFSKEETRFRQEHDQKENASSQSRIFGSQSGDGEEKEGNAIVNMLDFLVQLPEGIAVLDLDGGIDQKLTPSYASLEFDVVDAFEHPMAQKIKAVLKAIKEVELDFKNYEDPSFSSPYPTLNFGVIRTHDDHVVLLGSCKIPPRVSEEVYQRWMSQLREACHQVNGLFKVNEYFPPFRFDENQGLIISACSELKELGDSSPLETAPLSSEANTFARFGFNTLAFGPGFVDEQNQAENEFVELAALEKAFNFYQGFIARYCS